MKLNPNCSEVICRLPLDTDMSREDALKKLAEIGIKEIELKNKDFYDYGEERGTMLLLFDKDNSNTPDFANKSTINLQRRGEGYNEETDEPNDEGAYWAVIANQHCQHQIFPTLFKLERHFELIPGEDMWSEGGSMSDYNEWDQQPIKNYNKEFKDKWKNRRIE